VQEHFHIPSGTRGHEGYLGFIVDQHAENQSEVYILEAEHIDKGSVGADQSAVRLRVGVHGNWIAAQRCETRRTPGGIPLCCCLPVALRPTRCVVAGIRAG